AAIAINYQCTLCDTFAAAYQFVVQGSGPMHFTSDALRELKDVRKAIRELEDQNLDPFALQAALDPLIKRIQDVLTTGLVRGPPDGDDNDNPDQSGDGARPPNNPGDTTQTSTGPAATATLPAGTTTGTDTTQTTTAPTTTDTTPATTDTTPAT